MPLGWDFLFFAATTGLVCFTLFVSVQSQGWRRYPLLVAYLTVGLAGQVAGMVILSRVRDTASSSYALAYWTPDIVLHGLLIILLLFLMREALSGRRRLDKTGLLIVGGVALLAAAALYALFDPGTGKGWINPLSRDLSFCEEILNFFLWTILIRKRAHDVVLLLVSAGLGIQVTGEVIGRTLRLSTGSPFLAWVTNAIVLICEIGALLIWWRAFRTYGRRRIAERKAGAPG